MEELASLLLAADPSGSYGDLVASVYDQFLDFLVPSPSLFSLLPKRVPASSLPAGDVVPHKPKKGGNSQPEREVEGRPAYAILNDPKASEVEIEEEAERIARGLFSVIVTMGNMPIIRCPRGNAAEMVARKLDAKLRDYITSGVGSRGGGGGAYGDGLSGLQRPRECGSWRFSSSAHHWTLIGLVRPPQTSPGHLGPQRRSHPDDLTLVDVSSPGPRRIGHEVEQGDSRGG
jgi:hypothetical protein